VEAEGSLIPELRVGVASGPDNAVSRRDYRTSRVRQARRSGETQVNQCLNPRKRRVGSNPVDLGRLCGA